MSRSTFLKQKNMKTYLIEQTFSDGKKSNVEWKPERIKRAFNFQKGTEKDFFQYIENNKKTMKIVSSF